ncbi:MAG: hypothetical protein LBI61_03030 [Puniceicoccales bacterium]|jgi:hypothetical protein|nr:hypothetical protein [Puniceicoccales bacterium]
MSDLNTLTTRQSPNSVGSTGPSGASVNTEIEHIPGNPFIGSGAGNTNLTITALNDRSLNSEEKRREEKRREEKRSGNRMGQSRCRRQSRREGPGIHPKECVQKKGVLRTSSKRPSCKARIIHIDLKSAEQVANFLKDEKIDDFTQLNDEDSDRLKYLQKFSKTDRTEKNMVTFKDLEILHTACWRQWPAYSPMPT